MGTDCKIDKMIGEYIECYGRDKFSDVISQDERLEVAYYLSELPNGLLGWYPFQKDGNVLQIGSWFGAFTEMLCSRCRTVTIVEADSYRAARTGTRLRGIPNLEIREESILDYCRECSEKYDYIIFAVDENIDRFPDADSYGRVVSAVKPILAQEGKLFMILPNRFGIKYFCGEPDPATKVRFDGMTENNSGLYRFDRQELLEFIDGFRFPFVKMYYPMPDHHHTQMIYTDEYRPGPEIRERLHIYVAHKADRLLDEWPLVGRFAKNGVLHFFCNTFFLEMGNTPCSQVVYSAISAERDKTRAFATNIMRNGTVEKLPLYQEGSEGIQQLMKNTRELSRRGIPTLEMKEKDGRAVMRYVKEPSFSSYLREVVKSDRDVFLGGLDKLRDSILQSAEHVPPERNVMLELAPDEDWGVILEKAYLEMIPVNSFWSEGEILFYDQEFTKENCPADYVMFRALKDIYHLSPEINVMLPLDAMKERYGLTATWEYFAQEEERFQTELRRRNVYSGFFHWLRYLFDVVAKNRRMLEKGEGEREYFNPFSELDSRRIILFGAGKIMEYYFYKYGRDFPPAFIVDNNPGKWGSRIGNFEIKSPETIARLMPGTYRVIIAVKDFEPIVSQLENMGIGSDSYRIFNAEIDPLLEDRLSTPMTDGKYDDGYVAGKFDKFGMDDLKLFEYCKGHSWCLTVGVYTDEWIRAAENREPSVPFKERLEIVRQCKYVDRAVPVGVDSLNEIQMWRKLKFGCLFLPMEDREVPDTIWLQRKLCTLGAEVEFFPEFTE